MINHKRGESQDSSLLFVKGSVRDVSPEEYYKNKVDFRIELTSETKLVTIINCAFVYGLLY